MIPSVQGSVGQTVTLEGYADDFGNQIVAVEFSLDGGLSWASQDVSASDPNLSVHWTYSFTPQEAGVYKLQVRSITEDGRKSPEPAFVDIYVS